MREFVNWREPGANLVTGDPLPAHDAYYRSVRFRTDAPDMKVRYARVPGRFDQLAHFVLDMMIGRIEQN